MKSNSLTICLVTVVTMLSVCPISAQTTHKLMPPKYQGVTLAGGAATHGLSGYVSFTNDMKKGTLKIRYSCQTEMNILGPNPQEKVWDIGVMLGASRKSLLTRMSLSTGLALVGGVRRGEFLSSNGWFSSEYERLTFFTVGIPVESHFVWALSKKFGLGLILYANLNLEESFVGMAISLEFGNLK